MAETITVPEQDTIARYTLKQAREARAELAREGAKIAAKSVDELTDDDKSILADIQSATGAIGDRIDLLAAHEDRRKDFARLQELAEAGAPVPNVQGDREHTPSRGKARSFARAIADDPTIKNRLAEFERANREKWNGGAINVDVDLLHKDSPWVARYKEILGTDESLAGVDEEYPPQEARIQGVAGITETLFQQTNIANLFPNIPWTGETVQDVTETITDTAAAETAEGATIPEVHIEFDPRTVPIEKIAATLVTTLENLGQESFMRSFLGSRLSLFVRLREDLQLLKGNATPPNIQGIDTVSGKGNQNVSGLASATGQEYAEGIHAAAVDVMQAYLDPTAVIVSADGWGVLRLAKDLDGQYLNSVITEAGIPRIWGIPLVVNNNQNDITGATNGTIVATVVSRDAAEIYRRQGVTVSFTDSHASEFLTDVVRWKATERLALFVRRAAGISTVTAVT